MTTPVLGVWDYQPASDRFAWAALNDQSLAPLAADVRFLDAVRASVRGAGSSPCEEHRLDSGAPRWIGVFGGARGPDENRILGVAVDLSEQHRRQEEAELLVAEMDHRLKNMLAVVQAIASRTLRTAASLPEAQAILATRLSTLAQAQPWLRTGQGQGADLETLLRRTLAGFGREDQVSMRGPQITIGAKAAFGLSLVLHELTTNAIKYGALSGGQGGVAISWRKVDETAVRFSWRERGGPRVVPPARTGFGSRMIARALPDGAPPRLRFAPEGVRLSIDRLPLDQAAIDHAELGAPDDLVRKRSVG